MLSIGWTLSVLDTKENTNSSLVDDTEITNIILDGDNIDVNSLLVDVSDSIATITTAGTYLISGELKDGQIVVNAPDEDVEIILQGVNINNSEGPAIYVMEADDVDILLAENTENVLSDEEDYKDYDLKEDVPNATIYSMSDLKIKGASNATLKIVGKYKDGIASKDDLEINSANIEIEANDDCLRGKDSVVIKDSILALNAGGDGIKSDNEEDEKGNVSIETSEIVIDAKNDGIHAANVLEIFSGSIDIVDSFEGLEGEKITIHDGDIKLVSRDDGLNVSVNAEKYKGEDVLAGGELNIYGGKIAINSMGDGFDSNGNAVMTGGILIINGPTENNNGSIDVNGTFNVSGGTILAIGSSGMAEAPSDTSSQHSLQVNFNSIQKAGTKFSIEDSTGVEVFSYESIKQFQSVVYSSESLVAEETYDIFLDGQKYTSVSLDSVITIYGEVLQTRGRK